MHKGQYKGLAKGLRAGLDSNLTGLAHGLYKNEQRRKRDVDVYLFPNGGQSNDEKGTNLVSVDLDPKYKHPFSSVQYFCDDGVFRPLDSTNQLQYQSPVLVGTDNYANQFNLYPALQQLRPTKILYVVSYSVGDTALGDDWLPSSGPLYLAMLARINAAVLLLRKQYGKNPIVLPFMWDQGEKDGRNGSFAAAYDTNEQNLYNGIQSNFRVTLNDPTFRLKMITPLIKLGSINGSPNPVTLGGTINDKKKAVAAANPGYIITMDSNDYQPSTDGVHFTATGQAEKNAAEIQAMINAGWLPGAATVPPTGYTFMNGYSNYMRCGDILDSLFAAATSWRIKISTFGLARWTTRALASKFASTGNQRAWIWYTLDLDIYFVMYMGVGTATNTRVLKWTGAIDQQACDWELRYDGTVNTNNGLDRADLYKNGVIVGNKSLTGVAGSLGTIFNSTAQLAVSALVATGGAPDNTSYFVSGYLKNFAVQNGSGVDQLNIPNLTTGTDVSGNGNNGTFV